MVKNQFGGNKAKRRKNDKETSIDIIFKTNDQSKIIEDMKILRIG